MENNKDKAPRVSEEKKEFPGYPEYPEKDDIYQREKEDANAEGTAPDAKANREDAASFDEGLDVPGAELDDSDEAIGEEDEENNYYSLGGDEHNDLEDDDA